MLKRITHTFIHVLDQDALPLEPTVGEAVAVSGSTYVILANGDGVAPNCARIAIGRDGGLAWSVEAFEPGMLRHRHLCQ